MNSFDDCVSRYGKPWESPESQELFERTWMTTWHHWKIPQTHIYCNKDLVPILTQSFQALEDAGIINEIKTFDGCFNIRPIRGGTQWSQHSFGAAVDFNASEMPLGSPSLWSPEFIEIMKTNGWVWGGDFHRLDPQHFQIAHNC